MKRHFIGILAGLMVSIFLGFYSVSLALAEIDDVAGPSVSDQNLYVTLYLKDGGVLEGRIVASDENTITIESLSGGKISISRDYIKEIKQDGQIKEKSKQSQAPIAYSLQMAGQNLKSHRAFKYGGCAILLLGTGASIASKNGVLLLGSALAYRGLDLLATSRIGTAGRHLLKIPTDYMPEQATELRLVGKELRTYEALSISGAFISWGAAGLSSSSYESMRKVALALAIGASVAVVVAPQYIESAGDKLKEISLYFPAPQCDLLGKAGNRLKDFSYCMYADTLSEVATGIFFYKFWTEFDEEAEKRYFAGMMISLGLVFIFRDLLAPQAMYSAGQSMFEAGNLMLQSRW